MKAASSLRFAGRVAVVGALVLAAAVVPAAGSPELGVPAVVRDVATALGFGETDLARVWRGEIVARNIDERSERELAIAVIMRLRESHREFYERVRRGQFFEIDSTVLQAEEIAPAGTGPADFSKLRLDPDEVTKLGKAEPGTEFNLSRAEIDALRRAAAAGDESVLGAYRTLLAERLRAYQADGIDGVAPYLRRGAAPVAPARDLRLAIAKIAGLDDRCPSFYRSFADFPARGDPGVSHQFFWAVQRIQARPTVILSHWALQLHAEFAVVGERQFYVGHGYDAQQIVVGAFSIGHGESLVFYVNRTSTGQITGFGGSVARPLGRKLMLREVTALFREIRGAVPAATGSRTEGAR